MPVTPEQLWPRVADTNRFNRDADLPAVEGETPGYCTIRNGRRRLKLRKYGVLFDWDEEPFEWVQPHNFSVIRRYRSGPWREMHVDVRLEPTEQGTRVHYDVDAIPRNTATRPVTQMAIGVVSQVRFRNLFNMYAARAARDKTFRAGAAAPPLMLAKPAPLAAGGDARLIRAATELATQVNPELVEQIVSLIRFGDDATMLRMRPYALADAWRVPRISVLRAFLHATRAGMLSLQWDVVCPLCRGAKSSSESLSELASHVYCECCHANIDAEEFERAVELTFRPAPAIRVIDVQPYCVGGPMVTPHIVAQQLMPPHSSRTIPVALEAGEYRLRSLDRTGGRTVIVKDDDTAHSTLTIPKDEWPQSDAHIGRRIQLTLVNDSDTDELVIFERRAWADDAITAAEAFRIQDFRDLFARETLRAGQHLTVGSVAVLFTDVRDSTRLYREIGDAVAFARIREHFDVLRASVVRENGVVVKTIGDAVMAVFETPAAAVRSILRAAEALGAMPDGVQPVQLKAGLHYGPCIAVTLNDALDYFGSTVNTAARLGALAHGGDMVISEAAYRDGELADLAASLNLETSGFEALLKGVAEVPIQVWRISGTQRFGRC